MVIKRPRKEFWQPELLHPTLSPSFSTTWEIPDNDKKMSKKVIGSEMENILILVSKMCQELAKK